MESNALTKLIELNESPETTQSYTNGSHVSIFKPSYKKEPLTSNKVMRKIESIERGMRYGLGPIAIFQFKNGVDSCVYVYARMINDQMYIARRDMNFFKFTIDNPVTALGYITEGRGTKQVEFIIKNLTTEDGGYSFTIEYEVIF